MGFLKNSKKIEFINEIPGVSTLMPIIESKYIKHSWVNNALNHFSSMRKQSNWESNRLMHTARCPGIFTLQRHGWILRTWQDIVITTNGSEYDLTWRSASNIGGDAVGIHPSEQYSNYFEEWPENTLKTVIKINTGWRCNVPKGYYLMEMPVAHSGENRFTTVPGYFSREAGPASMNVQLLWHVKNGETLIKAGTPISQYVLVPKEQPDFLCRDEAEKDRLWLSRLYDASKFVKNYGTVKKLFNS